MGPGLNKLALDDIESLDDTAKDSLREYARLVFEELSAPQSKAYRKTVILDNENDLTYKLVAERNVTRPARSVEEVIKGLGLCKEATAKLVRGIKARKYKRYHLDDIKYVSDIIASLEPAQQKKAIDIVIENRKELYQVNKEDLVLFLLETGDNSSYHLDLWYSGIIRSLQKLSRQTGIGSEVLASLDGSQKKELKKKLRQVHKETTALLELLE